MLYKNLCDYIKENGGFMHDDIEYKNVNGVGGIYAKKDLSNDTEIGFVPNKIALTYNMSNYSDLVENIKNNESNPYIDNVPSLEDFKKFHPVYFSKEKIKDLQKYIRTDILSNDLKNIEILTKDKEDDKEVIELAYMISKTRAWGLPNNESILVPGVDLVNHSYQPNCNVILPTKENEFTMLKSINPIKKGDQLTITYGNKSVSELYFNYGFYDDSLDNMVSLGSSEFTLSLNISTALESYNLYNIKDKYNLKLFVVDNNKLSCSLNNQLFFFQPNGISLNLFNFLLELYGSNYLAWKKIDEILDSVSDYMFNNDKNLSEEFNKDEKEIDLWVNKYKEILKKCKATVKQNL